VLNLGRSALVLLTEITHRDPAHASRDVEELYSLLEKHGAAALSDALDRAVARGQLSVRGVGRALSTPAAESEEPRGHGPHQLELGSPCADRKDGAS
jgi:hypothetical protein